MKNPLQKKTLGQDDELAELISGFEAEKVDQTATNTPLMETPLPPPPNAYVQQQETNSNIQQQEITKDQIQQMIAAYQKQQQRKNKPKQQTTQTPQPAPKTGSEWKSLSGWLAAFFLFALLLGKIMWG